MGVQFRNAIDFARNGSNVTEKRNAQISHIANL